MSQTVLVINAGSSSVKFAAINIDTNIELVSGLAERLGSENAQISWKQANNEKSSMTLTSKDTHLEVFGKILAILEQLNLAQQISAVGHRVVHGGEKFSGSAIINSEVLAQIKHCNKLAPLHNPANLQGILAAQNAFPNLTQIAVFDTAFHQTLPEHAYVYPLPYSLYELEGIRRYGFHGTSHYYVANKAAKALDKPINKTNVITAHLGNGCSICAIKNGESVDTSMGFTPLGGIAMGTRCGDIDPGLIGYLINELDYSPEQLSNLLNKESGLLGISQQSNDLRELLEAKEQGNKKAELAVSIFCYQIAKTIAGYFVPLQRVDAIVFTGGIGENAADIRATVIEQLAFLGLVLDYDKNQEFRFGKMGNITANKGTSALVIPTNEELVIAQDAYTLANQTGIKE